MDKQIMAYLTYLFIDPEIGIKNYNSRIDISIRIK
jgi:hypothetical protein